MQHEGKARAAHVTDRRGGAMSPSDALRKAPGYLHTKAHELTQGGSAHRELLELQP